MVNSDGSGLKRVVERRLVSARSANASSTVTSATFGRPCWSPDGTMLAYPDLVIDDVRHVSYGPIYVINLDGTGKRAVTAPASGRE